MKNPFKKKEKQEVRLEFSPSFYESLYKMEPDPEKREALFKEIMKTAEVIKENPYVGTPIFAPPWVQALRLGSPSG